MRLSKRKTLILCGLIIVAIAAVTWAAVAKEWFSRPAADLRLAGDLAALSGLDRETVLKLYDAVGSWDTVRENIFLYKRVLNLAKQDPDAYEKVFAAAKKYKAGDMLTVYEFLAGHNCDLKRAEEHLSKHAGGTSLEDILAQALDEKTYKVYQPAGEDQVRAWLNAGYLPQDIINADAAARAKDLLITDVLALKKDSVTWDKIGRKLGYEFKVPAAPDAPAVTLTIREAGGDRTVSARDYETLVKEANTKAEKDKAAREEKICRELGLTAAQLAEYKAQGLTIWDMQNAARLAKKSGAALEQILQERRDGQTWETIIEKYSG